jgi:hypothetical protein
VFGTIAAENLGYARVELKETIAAGDSGCLVVVHLKAAAENEAAEGREYVKIYASPADGSESDSAT